MARGVNKVILVGNLGADPETRYTAGGAAITNISIATSESWKDKQTGENQERTEWHRVVFFNRLAEIERVPPQGQPGLCRGFDPHAQMAGAGRPGPVYNRSRCQRDADAG